MKDIYTKGDEKLGDFFDEIGISYENRDNSHLVAENNGGFSGSIFGLLVIE